MSQESGLTNRRMRYRQYTNVALGDYEHMLLSFEMSGYIDENTFDERKAKNPSLNRLSIIPERPSSISESSKRYRREKRHMDMKYFELVSPGRPSDRPYTGWWKTQMIADGLIEYSDYGRLARTEKGSEFFEVFQTLKEKLGFDE